MNQTTKTIAVIGANGGCEPSAELCGGRTNLLGSYTSYIHCERTTSNRIARRSVSLHLRLPTGSLLLLPFLFLHTNESPRIN